jgi:hypothetical protein
MYKKIKFIYMRGKLFYNNLKALHLGGTDFYCDCVWGMCSKIMIGLLFYASSISSGWKLH